MWIVLEGPDGAGKSTLTAALAARLNLKTSHLGPPVSPETAIDECVAIGQLADEHGLITDRLHWGCPVYGPIYRPANDVDGYGDFGRGGWRWLELFVKTHGGVTVLVTAPPDLLAERCKVRGDDYIDIEDLEQIATKYLTLANESVSMAHVNHYGVPDEEDMDRIIKVASEAWKERLPLGPNYLGSSSPKTVIVGQTSRFYQTAVLDAAGDDWGRLAFMNAAPSVTLVDTVDRVLKPERIITIGPILPKYSQVIDQVSNEDIAAIVAD